MATCDPQNVAVMNLDDFIIPYIIFFVFFCFKNFHQFLPFRYFIQFAGYELRIELCRREKSVHRLNCGNIVAISKQCAAFLFFGSSCSIVVAVGISIIASQ